MTDGLQPYQPPAYAHGGYVPATYQSPGMPVRMTDQRTNAAAVVIAWGLTLITFGYLLPWAIAATRGKSNATAVGLVNFFVGWTFIGWIAALVMACGAHQTMYAGAQTVNVMVAQQHFPQATVANTMVTPAGPAAGWYSAPDGTGGTQYWDGRTWTEHRQA